MHFIYEIARLLGSCVGTLETVELQSGVERSFYINLYRKMRPYEVRSLASPRFPFGNSLHSLSREHPLALYERRGRRRRAASIIRDQRFHLRFIVSTPISWDVEINGDDFPRISRTDPSAPPKPVDTSPNGVYSGTNIRKVELQR